MSDQDRDGNYVRLSKDSAYAEEQAGSIAVECPHCGAVAGSHELVRDGCDCGASVESWMRFDPE